MTGHKDSPGIIWVKSGYRDVFKYFKHDTILNWERTNNRPASELIRGSYMLPRTTWIHAPTEDKEKQQ